MKRVGQGPELDPFWCGLVSRAWALRGAGEGSARLVPGLVGGTGGWEWGWAGGWRRGCRMSPLAGVLTHRPCLSLCIDDLRVRAAREAPPPQRPHRHPARRCRGRGAGRDLPAQLRRAVLARRLPRAPQGRAGFPAPSGIRPAPARDRGGDRRGRSRPPLRSAPRGPAPQHDAPPRRDGGGQFPARVPGRNRAVDPPQHHHAGLATVFTGVNPAHHGITGNEYFIREKKQFAGLAPTLFTDPHATIEIYTDDAADALLEAPTVYERLRQTEPGIRIWVSSSMFHRGADLLLMAKRQVLTDAIGASMDDKLDKTPDVETAYAQLDEEVIEVIVEALEEREAPDVLTLYFAGLDLLAHDQGPNVRSAYLTKVVDPALEALVDQLEKMKALEDTFVVIVSDHGHSAVPDDDQHALDEEPRLALETAGFRVRPYEWKVKEKADFQAVIAGGGATAYIYVADRSTCAAEKTPCAWERPPRFEEDVILAAEAFSRMPGIGVVLTRQPRPFAEEDAPFEAYAGDGRLQPVSEWLQAHPHPSWVAVEDRLRELAVGPHGERAGDLLLLSEWPDDDPDRRYYFSRKYASWHGSPSARESSVVLIVGRREASAEALETIVREVTGDRAEQDEIADLLLRLRGR